MITKDLLQPFHYLFDSEILDGITNTAHFKTFKKYDIIIDLGQDLHFIPLLIHGNIDEEHSRNHLHCFHLFCEHL